VAVLHRCDTGKTKSLFVTILLILLIITNMIIIMIIITPRIITTKVSIYEKNNKGTE